MLLFKIFTLIFFLFSWGKAFAVLHTQTADFSLQDSIKIKDYSAAYFRKASPFAVLAQSETVDTLDPFVDYNEFQDNEEEKESIAFLKSGRLLTIGILGGYEALTPNIREIYGDTLGVFGAYISFFFDLQVALQLSTVFPRQHYFNIIPESRPVFSSYGIDFKYYFARQNLVEGIAILNPYVIFGPFLIKISNFFPDKFFSEPVVPPAVQTPVSSTPSPTQTINATPVPTSVGTPNIPFNPEEQANVKPHSKVGAKIGLGLEIPFFKQTFIGIELTYLYLPLPFEARSLEGLREGIITRYPKLSIPRTQSAPKKRHFLARAIEPEIPNNIHQKRFFGDLVQGIILIGINF